MVEATVETPEAAAEPVVPTAMEGPEEPEPKEEPSEEAEPEPEKEA